MKCPQNVKKISELSISLHKIAIMCTSDSHIGRNLSLVEEIDKGSIHQVTAVFGRSSDDIGNLGRLAFADQVPDSEVHQHDFCCQHTAVAA